MNYASDIFLSDILLESVYRMTNDLPPKSADSFFSLSAPGRPLLLQFQTAVPILLRVSLSLSLSLKEEARERKRDEGQSL